MKSRRSTEGYLLIDHTASPGISEAEAIALGDPTQAVPEGRIFESATMTCKHCQAIVVLNPNRSREREWCFACDSYVCDTCGAAKKAGAPCKTYAQRIDEILATVSKGISI